MNAGKPIQHTFYTKFGMASTNNASGFNARTWLSTTWNIGGFSQILLLADPNAGCNFDETRLQYANGTAATPSTFLKLSFFVRLWKKLGWTLDEIDLATADPNG